MKHIDPCKKNESIQKGALQYLPSKGRMIVLADLHGRNDLYEQTLTNSKYDPDDDILLLLGDIVDNARTSGEDKRLLEKIIFMKKTHKEKIILLKGNHEWESEMRYGTDMETGCFVFYRKMELLHFNFFQSLPLASIAPNGLFFTHNVPFSYDDPISALEKYTAPIVMHEKEPNFYETLHMYYSGKPQQKYIDLFLAKSNTSLIISGHNWAQGLEELCPGYTKLGTAHSKEPCYLEIDLGRTYDSYKEIPVHKIE